MIQFVSMGTNGDHLVPDDEQEDHTPHDFCGCHPQQRPYMGRWLWIHQRSVENEIFEQAEAIRQVTSINLWREIEGKKLKFEVIPFPEGFQGAVWPAAAPGHEKPKDVA